MQREGRRFEPGWLHRETHFAPQEVTELHKYLCTRKSAEQIAADVDGYPYFLQWFGEALWDAADLDGQQVIDGDLYANERESIQQALDSEFFEPRYRDANRADQQTLRVAADLEGEQFDKSELLKATTTRTDGAITESLRRLITANILYRDDHGVYAYTAPVFGDFLRRRHPRLDEDG